MALFMFVCLCLLYANNNDHLLFIAYCSTTILFIAFKTIGWVIPQTISSSSIADHDSIKGSRFEHIIINFMIGKLSQL